jgi:hypothetical protein
LSFGVEKCRVARLNWRLGGFESGVDFELAETRERGVWMREVRSCDLTLEVSRGRNMIDAEDVTWGFKKTAARPGENGTR